MGRSKTRKKNQRSGSGQISEDPDISETEPSSSDNVSNSLNETMVLSSSNNVMDTDVEDSEQTTGDSTPADESVPVVSDANVESTADGSKCSFSFGASADSTSTNVGTKTRWLDEEEVNEELPSESQPPSVNCAHVKGSVSMAGLRKAMKNDVQATCSARPCADLEQSGAGENDEVSSKELWICLQCGNFGCGDQTAQGGDAEAHYKTPRSDQHNIVLRLGGDMEKSWCFNCQTFVDTKHTSLKEAIQFLKRHPKVKSSLQSKAKTGTAAPVIALGPPPPPPQPEIATQFKSSSSFSGKNKVNSRNKMGTYGSNWDNSNRDEWPLGLENLGNTCFMNSALQCLSRTKTLIPKLDLYGTGSTLEIMVTAEPAVVEVLGTVTPDTNGDNAASFFQLGSSTEGTSMEENGETNGVSSTTDGETGGGSSPSSSDMDSLLDVASGGASSKSSPSKELAPANYSDEIEKELKKSLRLRLIIPKESMTARLRHAFKAMTRSADVQPANGSYHSTEYFGRGRHVFTPSAIHGSMSKNFRAGQQHDSHELLRTVVDMMKKDQIKAFRLAIMNCYGLKKTDGKNCDPKVAELLKQWDRKLYHKTFVDEIFGGELVTFQTCLTCNSVRRSHEDFLDLSLPIRVYTKNQLPKRTYSLFDDDGDSNRSLEDCLKSFIEPEQLTGSNAVECETCHKRNLEKLANGASFEEVFPGVKPPTSTPAPEPLKKSPVEPEPALETEMDALEPLGIMEDDSAQNYGNSTEDMEPDDLDEPAVDGIIGNTSDMEDEGNDVPPVFLPIDESEVVKGVSTAEFINSTDLHNKENMTLSLAATQDEGFSESDSSEEKKSASISASSSRNSISEAENGAASSSSLQKGKETSKPIPITKCPCSRRQMVLRPPECLTVHLKRFQITSHGTSKLSDRVNFPYILNLTPFCARDDEDLQRLDGQDVYDEDGEVKYALYGIVEHSGSLHWGHYVAYIKVPVGQNSSNGTTTGGTGDEGTCSSSSEVTVTPDKWFYISDSSVSPSSLESVLGMDPYILFYERIRGQEKKDRLNQLHRLNNPSCSTSLTFEPTTATASSSSTTTYNDSNAVATDASYSLD